MSSVASLARAAAIAAPATRRAAPPRPRASPRRLPRAASRVAASSSSSSSSSSPDDAPARRRLELTPKGDDTPEQILRVSRGTSFEGLKVARRDALEAANAEGGGGAARVAKVETAFDALIAESRNFFLGAVESAPTDANARFRLGNFYQTLEKFDDAEKCYRAAAALDNAHVDAMNNLAMILQERGGDAVDEAEAYYLRCVEVDPKYVARHVSTDVLSKTCRLDHIHISTNRASTSSHLTNRILPRVTRSSGASTRCSTGRR
jgi:tetratricopeptide (TPR) repeat protein